MARNSIQTARRPKAATIGLFLAGTTLLAPLLVVAAPIVLDTNDISGWTQEGGQAITTSPFALNFNDASSFDTASLYMSAPDAAKGNSFDLYVSFKVGLFLQNRADTGLRFIINDGQSRSALAALTIDGAGTKGMALAKGVNFALTDNYSAFIPVNWTAPTTLHLRRHANGDAEIVEVNGIAPSTPALLPAAESVGFVRAFPTVEFGTFGVEPMAVLDVFELRAFATPVPVPAAVWLLGSGLLGLIGVARRMKK